MSIGHRFRSVLSLVSRLPVAVHGKPDYTAAAFFIPFIGLLAGILACAGTLAGLALFGPGLLAALCGILIQYLAFNLFHFDGLLDSADAAGAFGDHEVKRAILKDPRIGAFAMFAGFMLLAGRAAASVELLEYGNMLPWAALLTAPAVGRLAAIQLTWVCAPASATGLAAALGRLSRIQAIAGYISGALPGAILAGHAWAQTDRALSTLTNDMLAILVCTVAWLLAGRLLAWLVGTAVGNWYSRHIGGFTGDAMGAALELGEVAMLLSAVVLGRYAF
jgi:adenosylcobinamide-GDP ribazoletransferase